MRKQKLKCVKCGKSTYLYDGMVWNAKAWTAKDFADEYDGLCYMCVASNNFRNRLHERMKGNKK